MWVGTMQIVLIYQPIIYLLINTFKKMTKRNYEPNISTVLYKCVCKDN